MNALDFVAQLEALYHAGRGGGVHPSPARRSTPIPDAPTVLIVSPHPDDECIVGGLALRLARQHGWRVVNLAVTLGSNPLRQAARADELRAACAYLGFELQFAGEDGLTRVTPRARETEPAHWVACVTAMRAALETAKPQLVIAPHVSDAQATHVGTHWLVADALKSLPATFQTTVAWSEYWSTLPDPNVLVGHSAEDVATLISALTFHAGEIARNPYHLSLPFWMKDAVRRGSERVGSAGGAVAASPFATLYRAERWANNAFSPAFAQGQIVSTDQELAALFR